MARAIASRHEPAIWNPVAWLFRLLTSVRFAVALVSLIAVAVLLGVLVPQVPEFGRDEPSIRAAFFVEQAERYGPLSRPLQALGIYEIFRSGWFNFLLGLLVLSIAVCTCCRLPVAWRQVRHTQKDVPATWFDSAHFRAMSSPAPATEAITAVLRRRHYHVEVLPVNGETRLFADRYRWSPLGTFVSHLALVIFLAGGIVTWRLGQQERVVIAEGRSAPVFGLDDPAHMQVRATSVIHEWDSQGRERDVATNLEVYRGGELVAAGRSTINHPLRYDGFLFHQSALAENGVALEVRNAAGGTTYSEVVALDSETAAPRVRVTAADGAVLLDDIVPPAFLLGTGLGGAVLPLATSLGRYTVALRQTASAGAGEIPFRLVVGAPTGELQEAAIGDSLEFPEVTIEFEGLVRSVFGSVTGVPGMEDGALVQLIDGGEGAFLVLTPASGGPVRLEQGQAAALSGNTYVFPGRRSFTGITIRKDPGTAFIWIATALLLFGLGATFYLPRRRIWVRITGDRMQLAGLAERGSEFSAELQEMCSAADARTRLHRE